MMNDEWCRTASCTNDEFILRVDNNSLITLSIDSSLVPKGRHRSSFIVFQTKEQTPKKQLTTE